MKVVRTVYVEYDLWREFGDAVRREGQIQSRVITRLIRRYLQEERNGDIPRSGPILAEVDQR